MRHKLRRSRALSVVVALATLMAACSSRSVPTLEDAGPDTVLCRWHTMNSGTTEDLWAIWGSGSHDVFVVGTVGTILHFDGSSWSPMTGPPKRIVALWGSGPTNVYGVAFSSGENVYRYDGSAWTVGRSGAYGLLAVWGSARDDIYAVGSSTTIVHLERGKWYSVSDHDQVDLFDVWGTSPDNVYVVGSEGTAIHYNGSSYRREDTGVSDSLRAVTGLGAKVYALATGPQSYLLNHDNDQWHRIDLPQARQQSLVKSMGSWGRELVLLGIDVGLLLLYDGQTWREESTGVAVNLNRMWSPGPDEIFITGDKGTILHYYCPP